MNALLQVRDLRLAYGATTVVHDVDLEVPAGPFGVGLIGESGSGKTTIARSLLRLHPVAGGSVTFDGRDVLAFGRRDLRAFRRECQLVFQDGDNALDPRMSVLSSIREPWAVHGTVPRAQHQSHAAALLYEVGLPAELLRRYPHQLSGGQRQRVVIARALALEPKLLILDEPTSALDVTVQEKILQLVESLRESRGLAYLLISHNLAVVSRLCETSVVLYRGEIMEQGPTAAILARPQHPYTRALRAAVPEIGATRKPLTRIATRPDSETRTDTSTSGSVGCPYAGRCPMTTELCRTQKPPLRPYGGRLVACHRVEDADDLLP